MSAAELLPSVRELFSRYPKAAGFSPERIAHGLKMLGYVGQAPNPYEVAGALEVLDVEREEAAGSAAIPRGCWCSRRRSRGS